MGIYETILCYGLFYSLYTDRGSHYGTTPEAGGKVDKSRPTQVGLALKRLNITHIFAYSPQARGRSERMFSTLQGRLPKELALRGITTMAEANRYLREEYIHEHNKEFSCEAKEAKSAYHPWSDKEKLWEDRYHYAKCGVVVRQYLDGSLGVFYGPACIGRYDRCANPVAAPSVELSTGPPPTSFAA